MTNPSPTELRIIRLIVTENLGPDSSLLSQIPLLRFPEHHMTGTGYFVHFDPLPEPFRVDKVNTVISTDLMTKLAEPQDLIAFTLFINDGFLTSFEGYTFGDVAWPDDPIEKWVILEDYELAESTKTAPAIAPTQGRHAPRNRRDSKRDAILQLLRDHPEGLTRDEILERMKLKGDQSSEISVTNTLTALAKGSQLIRREGKYRAAEPA